MLSPLIFSIGMSLPVAFGATIIGALVGTSLGVLGHAIPWRRRADGPRPGRLLGEPAIPHPGARLLRQFADALRLPARERCARIARGLVISVGAQGYAAVVRQLGASPWRTCGRHILPNIASTLIVSMTPAFPEIILLESGLSFPGLGVQPPETSLPSMVGYGREYLTRAPWILLPPTAVIVLTTLPISVLGDRLRDRVDPTLN